MRIGGVLKLSLIDYPDKMSCVIFTQGCNFRCRYCHNPQLVLPEQYGPTIPEEEVLDFLNDRREFLQGVVISGGEPTIQKGLIPFMLKIKKMGYAIKLDTNGSQPQVIEELLRLKLVDYIAMDIKATVEKYEQVIDAPLKQDCITQSVELIVRSGLPYQFRTTVVKSLCSYLDLCRMRLLVGEAGSYRLQRANLNDMILDKKLSHEPQYTEREFERLKEMFEKQPQEEVSSHEEAS